MSQGTDSGGAGFQSLWVAFVLFATAGLLWMNPLPFESPVPESTTTLASVTDTTPVRQPALEPTYTSGVYKYRCSECHKILPSPPETQRSLTQHTEIHLEHGINTRCFNCHHPTNRDAFIDDMGDEIPWDQPQLLCAKCHGPVYRDWQHGSHGRTNGYWDPAQGEQTRRKCIECHDPHHPPFQPLAPAPGPATLRMGPQQSGSHGHGSNPLHLAGQGSGREVNLAGQEGH